MIYWSYNMDHDILIIQYGSWYIDHTIWTIRYWPESIAYHSSFLFLLILLLLLFLHNIVTFSVCLSSYRCWSTCLEDMAEYFCLPLYMLCLCFEAPCLLSSSWYNVVRGYLGYVTKHKQRDEEGGWSEGEWVSGWMSEWVNEWVSG